MFLSVRFSCLLIDQFIDQSINRWILMSLIGNRHGQYLSPLDLCSPIDFSASLLMDHSGNASLCLMWYWCVPPYVMSVQSIKVLINQLIGEYWWMGFEIYTARPRHHWFVSTNRHLCISVDRFFVNQRMRKLKLLSPVNVRPPKRISISWLLCSETNEAKNPKCRFVNCPLSNKLIPLTLNDYTAVSGRNGVSVS